MDSLWKETATAPSFDMLSGEHRCDVLVIGGGIAGLLCAFMLRRKGIDCILVTEGKICDGTTQNTTAKITLQHGLIYDKIIRKYGTERARQYLLAQRAAMEQFDTLCEVIDCDYTHDDAYVYSISDKEKIEREVGAYEKLGYPADFVKSLTIPISAVGAVRVRNQARFNPLKFAYSIAKDLPIYENTKVLELTPRMALTNRGRIFAEKIVVATHFPFLNKHGFYFIKMYQHRSYVIALKGALGARGMFVDESDLGMSFRDAGDFLLLGGGGHRTGKKGGCWGELQDFARQNYPEAQESFRWAAQDCMTLDGIPYIGQYSKKTENLFVAGGFNKWGMTSSMAAAMILSDLVLGKKNDFADVFSPSRSILQPQLILNTSESLLGLLTPTAPRCPHLGCALRYNPEEHSWDCPCHGSRFGEDGELLNNPATDGKKDM